MYHHFLNRLFLLAGLGVIGCADSTSPNTGRADSLASNAYRPKELSSYEDYWPGCTERAKACPRWAPCVVHGDAGVCAPPCETVADCVKPEYAPEGLKQECVDYEGSKACIVVCQTDADCPENLRCADGLCRAWAPLLAP